MHHITSHILRYELLQATSKINLIFLLQRQYILHYETVESSSDRVPCGDADVGVRNTGDMDSSGSALPLASKRPSCGGPSSQRHLP